MIEDKKYLNIIDHYESCLKKYGDTHKGVDWPKMEDVDKRYQVMLELIFYKKGLVNEKEVSLLDFGCGASHLLQYIQRHKINNIKYSGLEISKEFFELSKSKFPGVPYYCIDLLQDSSLLPNFDYVVMNGVFTEKISLSFDEMFSYFKSLLREVFKKTNRGIAFNVMSKAVDWEREDLFHLSADLLINFLSKELSRNFILRNDYGLYEYTVYLYK